ncbi:MAG: oligogalacturonate lyase family protein [Bacteroides sp.]|nr:oligogalacturonate lyase family protein [Bacteroides sp.]
MNRKIIIFFLLHFIVLSVIRAESKTSDFGKSYPSEKKVITDPVTGTKLTVLTSSDYSVTKPYQTHETWTSDGKWIVFHSKRVKDISQIFIVNESTGDIIQLTDYPDVLASTINLSRKEMKLFYIRGTINNYRIIKLDMEKLIADSMSGKLKSPKNYEQVIAKLLPDITGTELALDADETCIYWGSILYRPEMTMKAPVSPKSNDKEEQMKYRKDMKAYFEAGSRGNSVIYKIEIADGTISKVLDINFRMGHLQANPWVPGEIIYCKESGGDTDQRMWTVLKDGSNNRPLYMESPEEWITHESMSAADKLMFIISGHVPHLREKPTGIATVNIRTGEVELLGQVKEASNPGGFWHCNGSPDGRWAVGDTHAGSIYIINQENGERILLTTGHKMRPDHTHPIFSADGRRILIQSGMLTDGKKLNLIVMNIPE